MLLTILHLAFLALLAVSLLLAYESWRERQARPLRIGLGGAGVCLLCWALVSVSPAVRGPVAVALLLGCLGFAALFRGARPNPKALAGASGHLVGDGFEPSDERDIVFARNRSIRPGSEQYRTYYEEMHPERKEVDDQRRAVGGPLGVPGSIDKWAPNTAMVGAMLRIPAFLTPHAEAKPEADRPRSDLAPERASQIAKGLARHLGAVDVGVCRVDPRWAYSHRGEIHLGNWEDWGKPITADLPYAVVIATEMDHTMVGAGPHTPAVIESMKNYALGAHITTVLAQWFAGLGYRGEANHSRFYKYNLVPLAIDAGLGELGRFGYLINDRVGARCRLFACLTDMPLAPDQPVDLGVEGFCEGCMKCAESCPSRSIPRGDQTVSRGVRRWTLNAETCFGYWGKVGTDCSICMGVCPFSRPNRSLHWMVRWVLKRSPRAQRWFPALDNFLYGRRWKPQRAAPWVDPPPRRPGARPE